MVTFWMLCSLCSLYRLPRPSIFFLCDMLSIYFVNGPYAVRLCAGCAQDGQSRAVQAWPSHSRWSCKPGIHGIRGRGAVPTHGSREPSDAPVRSRTSVFQERLIDDVQQAGYDRINLYVALASPTQSVALALLSAFRESYNIISHNHIIHNI